MPEYRQQLVEVKIQSILTLADAVVLVQHLGLKLALQFICSVDPWMYRGEEIQAQVSHRRFIQSAVDKANVAGMHFFQWT